MKWGILLGVTSLAALAGGATATGCGSDGNTLAPPDAAEDSTGGGTDSGPTDAPPDVAEASASATTLTLPQFIHGAARVDRTAFHSIPIVVLVSGAAPGGVSVTVDTAIPVVAKATDATHFVATLDATTLSDGAHMLTAKATAAGGQTMGIVTGSLVSGINSLQFTKFATVGPAYSSNLVMAPSGDRLAYTWVSEANGSSHQLFLNYLDGASARLMPSDVVINDSHDEPLNGYTAFSNSEIGVVYNMQKPGDSHWLVKMRVVDSTGAEKVPVMDLTQGHASFYGAAAGVDPGGFSAAWLHIRPLDDGGNTQPVEVRFARWDTAKGQLVGPIVLDADQPQPTGSSQGPQTLETLDEMSIACNTTICLVLYTRDEYNALVQLNVPKLFLAKVDLASGHLVGTPQAVSDSDWDTQGFGEQIIALPDGTFELMYTASDTATAVNPITQCDMTERDLVLTMALDATGAPKKAPAYVFNTQGQRQYPRIAPHPAGWALFWEDQRSECNSSGGHIGMAMNVAATDLGSLLDPYLEATGTIVLPPMYPTMAVTGTSFVVAWTDNRDGMGLLQSKSELFFETYWR